MAKNSYKFDLGQKVYVIHDPEQHERMIVAQITNFNGILFGVSCGDITTDFFEQELSTDKNVI